MSVIRKDRLACLTALCEAKGDKFISLDKTRGDRYQEMIIFERNGVVEEQRFRSYTAGYKLKDFIPKKPKVAPEDKYKQRSETQRKCYLERLQKLCESRGDVFISLDDNKETSYAYGIYFERDGEVKYQNVHSYRNNRKLKEDYLEDIKRWPEGNGVYKFYSGDELIYIGKTNNFNTRFQSHFKTYKNKAHYKTTIGKNISLVDRIEICELGEADTNIYEMYLLAKHKPRFNERDTASDYPSFELPEIEFQELTGWK